MTRVRRVLGEILRAAGVPQTDLDNLHELLLEFALLRLGDVLEGEIAVAELHHLTREEPEVIVGAGRHIRERELLFLRQVGRQLHLICGTL